MNICENCIHSNVCRYSGEPQESCSHRKTEEEALHTIRLIYADFMEGANRMRTRSEQSSMRGRAAEAADLRRDAEIRQHCAYKVVYYCRRICFDPNPREE